MGAGVTGFGLPALRPDGWEARLAAVIGAARTRPFVWGRHDCTTWAAEVVEAVSGVAVRPWWAGCYRTARGARAHLKRMGFEDLAIAVTALTGRAPVGPETAQRGDLVLKADERALGVCIGRDALFLDLEGLSVAPMTAVRMAWRL